MRKYKTYPEPAGHQSWLHRTRNWLIVGASIIIGCLLIAWQPWTTAQPSSPVTIETTVTATPTPNGPTSPAPETTATAPTPEASDPTTAPTSESASFVMPDLVGQNLQDAQDTLQNLGSYLLDQEDATGKGRPQIMDRNWQVCSQHPAAGTRVQVKDMVTLRAVKNSETCP